MSTPRFTTSRQDSRILTVPSHRIERRGDYLRLRSHGELLPMESDTAPTWASIVMWGAIGMGAGGFLFMLARVIFKGVTG